MEHRTARYAVAQSLSEVVLGSWIHAAHLPFGGHLLSLNQSLLLTFAARGYASRREAARSVQTVSHSAAVLKALSPVGKRLTPMLAISVQGLLYALGLTIAGANAVGAALGAALASVWGFVQPVLVAYVLLGAVFFEAIAGLWKDAASAIGADPAWGPAVLLSIGLGKAIAAAAMAASAWLARPEKEEAYLRRLERFQPAPASGAKRSLWLAFSLGLTILFFALSAHPTAAELSWHVLRFAAGALILYWAGKALTRERLARLLSRFPGVQSTVDAVLRNWSRT